MLKKFYRHGLKSCLFLLLFFSLSALGQDQAYYQRVSEVSQIEEPRRLITTRAFQLASPQVVVMDRELIEHDFPFLKDKSDAFIKHWLLEQGGYISEAQLETEGEVTEGIKVTKATKQGYRRKYDGRVSNFEALNLDGEKVGYINAKGVGVKPGVRALKQKKKSGVAHFQKLLREFFMEKLIRKALRKAGLPYKTVGCYAVIDAGFNYVTDTPAGTVRAGLLFRQAHTRSTFWEKATNGVHYNNFLESDVATEIEVALRQFGISSTSHTTGPQLGIRGMNIQGTAEEVPSLIDFTHFRIVREFDGTATFYPHKFKATSTIDAHMMARIHPEFDYFPAPTTMDQELMTRFGCIENTPNRSDEPLVQFFNGLAPNDRRQLPDDTSIKVWELVDEFEEAYEKVSVIREYREPDAQARLRIWLKSSSVEVVRSEAEDALLWMKGQLSLEEYRHEALTLMSSSDEIKQKKGVALVDGYLKTSRIEGKQAFANMIRERGLQTVVGRYSKSQNTIASELVVRSTLHHIQQGTRSCLSNMSRLLKALN